ncbi:MAG: hypothetical protein KDD46_02770 [Bdellovibrionales bacterium]|nr:hypothetical protein [Bdellovibrionales bacterium]
MNRKAFIAVFLVSLILGYAVYYFTPLYWHLSYQWEIFTGDDISKERVETYHQAWTTELFERNLDSFVKVRQCTLSGKLWSCFLIASDYKSYKQMQDMYENAYFTISGWVDPQEIRQETQAYTKLIEHRLEQISSLTEKIEKLERQIDPKRPLIQPLIEQRDLYQQDLDLRSRQIQIYEKLLPTMDPTSELAGVYAEQASQSKNRIEEIKRELSGIDQKINRDAKEWIELAELIEKNEEWTTDVQNLRVRKFEFEQSLQKIDHHKAPHPRQYAFYPRTQDAKMIHQASLLFPSILVVFFLLSNMVLGVQKLFTKRQIRTKKPRNVFHEDL